VVRAGETISGIASRYGISQAQLIAANGLTDGRIYLGQQLRLVPVGGPAPTTATRYAVRAGDTLSSIAQRFGTTVRALQSANGLTDPDTVVVGRTLTVPAGGTGGGGSIVCPVQGPITFMNDWGFPRSGGRFHEGNDLFAPRGRPAVATVSGTAVQTVGSIGGHQVKLLGDDGVSYYYTHLDRFGTGGRVAAGTIIGYVGNTGNAAGGATHVHFEVHPGGGAAVNPYPRLVPVC
jgi:murein DD-endopeptidase MepM/ murein hydrolase activator NlpD